MLNYILQNETNTCNYTMHSRKTCMTSIYYSCLTWEYFTTGHNYNQFINRSSNLSKCLRWLVLAH